MARSTRMRYTDVRRTIMKKIFECGVATKDDIAAWVDLGYYELRAELNDLVAHGILVGGNGGTYMLAPSGRRAVRRWSPELAVVERPTAARRKTFDPLRAKDLGPLPWETGLWRRQKPSSVEAPNAIEGTESV